jgi:hypothetical protein
MLAGDMFMSHTRLRVFSMLAGTVSLEEYWTLRDAARLDAAQRGAQTFAAFSEL